MSPSPVKHTHSQGKIYFSLTISSIEEYFEILCSEHKKIGLEFNAEISEVVSIGMSRNQSIPDIVCLDGHRLKLLPSINYLGLPTGNDLNHSRELLLRFLGTKLRKANGLLASCKARY